MYQTNLYTKSLSDESKANPESFQLSSYFEIQAAFLF